MTPSPIPAPVFQMHSRDYLLRLPAAALERIVWQHVCTVEDPAVLDGLAPVGTRVGFTEWQGAWQDSLASLGWDWIRLSDGALQILPAVGPRTNVRLLDERGYDLGAEAESRALLEFIRGATWLLPIAATRLA